MILPTTFRCTVSALRGGHEEAKVVRRRQETVTRCFVPVAAFEQVITKYWPHSRLSTAAEQGRNAPMISSDCLFRSVSADHGHQRVSEDTPSPTYFGKCPVVIRVQH